MIDKIAEQTNTTPFSNLSTLPHLVCRVDKAEVYSPFCSWWEDRGMFGRAQKEEGPAAGMSPGEFPGFGRVFSSLANDAECHQLLDLARYLRRCACVCVCVS